jgi:N-acetylglucosamine-6-phosphate deacetylase
MKKAFTNAIVFTGKEKLTDSAVLVADKKIEAIVPATEIPSGYIIHDLNGNNIAPAFIDLQIYGGNGYLFSANPSTQAVEATYNYCMQGGCAHFLLTMATNSKEIFSKGIQIAKQYLNVGGKGLLGLHLEGPWINAIKRGAHAAEYIHQPTLKEVKELVQEGEGVIKMITLAPEEVDEAVIDYLQQHGIIVSVGHSNATYKQATQSFTQIKTVTHLFNAMSPLQSREPGMVGAIYDHPSVCASFVADGIHVDYAVLRTSKKILKERLFLITDAVSETSEGTYTHVFNKDRYTLPDGTLSGSALTMMQAVKNCVQYGNIDLEEALRMASLYPAKIIGIESDYGLIKENYAASFVVFDNDMKVIEVIPN